MFSSESSRFKAVTALVWTLAIVAFVSLPGNTMAEHKDGAVIQTDWDRAYLALYALTEAISNPDESNLHYLYRSAREGHEASAESGVRSLAGMLESYQTGDGVLTWPLVRFTLKGVTQLESGYTADVIWYLEAPGFLVHLESSPEFRRHSTVFVFEDIGRELNRLTRFVEEQIPVLQVMMETDDYPPPGMPTTIDGYHTDKLIMQKNLFQYGSRVVPTMNVTTSLANCTYGGEPVVIFNRPHGIKAIRTDISGSDWDHNFLLVTDATWNRIITSDTCASKFGVDDYGTWGTGAGQFRNPVTHPLGAC